LHQRNTVVGSTKTQRVAIPAPIETAGSDKRSLDE
jgi:hypothetical protein